MLTARRAPAGAPATAHCPGRRQVSAPTTLRPWQVERTRPRPVGRRCARPSLQDDLAAASVHGLSLIHISEPTRLALI
eukprot:1768034-Alexandrium_andersonii.AAC.1